jgi:hypothetical protein
MGKLKGVFHRQYDNKTEAEATGDIEVQEITIPTDGYRAWIQVLVGQYVHFYLPCDSGDVQD